MLEDSPLLKAIELYADITGVKVPESERDRYGSMSFRKYDILKTYDALKEALELDPSEVTANLMLSYYVRDLLSDQKLSMLNLLDDPDAFLAKLEKPRELLAIVNRPDITEARATFIANLTKALNRYCADQREDIQKLLTQHDNIAFLRRDALRGVERLQINQFLRGEPEPSEVRPVFHSKVFQWWNINSLLAAATSMPSGVSLNLIRDRDEYQSYFVFCIRNGGNLFVLTDAPQYSHPLQGMMTRRPDRALGERSCRAWFPYDLLGLKWDEEQERYYIERSDEKAVAVYQQEHKVLKPIAELDPAETVWTTMMLDLIVRKFWNQGYQAPQLSYTGEMIKIEDRLIEKAQTANLPVAAYQPLALPALAVEDILTDAVDEAQVGRKAHSPNRWLEERYKDKVNPAILNLVEQAGTVVLLPTFKPNSTFDKTPDGTIIEGGMRKLSSTDVSKLGHFFEKDVRGRSLVVMDSTKFGTREQLEADRKFLARHNFATQINDLAYDEFKRREKEVVDWYVKACKKNLPAILSWCAHDEIWLDMGEKTAFSSNSSRGPQRQVTVGSEKAWRPNTRIYRSLLKRRNLIEERRTKDYDYSAIGAHNLGGWSGRDYTCAVTDAKATYEVVFYPSNAEELAVLAGVAVDELPDVLQHWSLAKDYIGNSILDRIDPMNWHAHDPWRKLNLKVRVPLSIRGLAKVEKAPGLPPLSNIVDRAVVYQERKQIADDLNDALGGGTDDDDEADASDDAEA
jgi:hypothetical protein